MAEGKIPFCYNCNILWLDGWVVQDFKFFVRRKDRSKQIWHGGIAVQERLAAEELVTHMIIKRQETMVQSACST